MKLLRIELYLLISYLFATVASNPQKPELVVIGYNSYDAPLDTLLFGSIDENDARATDGTDRNIQSVGLGSHLWIIDENGPEIKRGWMFRLRLTMQHVKDEYYRRGKQDFVVVVADAMDVYVKGSLDKNTLEQLNDRFLTEFSNHKIVFSAQIYCCNPWEMREFGRRDWDMFQNKSGSIPSMFKHLNAGTFMGYASAIIEMADEMNLWSTTYHHHENFHSLVGLESSKGLHMMDIEVDDDEWQLAAWFFNDQNKAIPLATLDYQQNLFAVTGTFRVQETDDNSYILFSRQHFYDMFGPFPNTMNKVTDMDQLVECPYEYDATYMEFTSTISGGKPLIFHFAGNDWLCACTVFAHQDFQNVPKKFRDNCEQRYSIWFEPVQEGIRRIAHSTNKNLELQITVIDNDTSDERQLRSVESRDLAIKPYKGMKKSNPYKEQRGLVMMNDIDPPRDIRSKSNANSNTNNIFFHSIALDSTNPYQMDMRRRRRRRRRMRRRRGPRGLKEDELW